MHYVYVLKSQGDGGLYIGCTKDLYMDIKAHNSGHVQSTKNRLPMDLIYYEASLNGKDAFNKDHVPHPGRKSRSQRTEKSATPSQL
ncbi:MAG: GIY-YIG nuclease family protein [Desulfobacterales bacterium]|nr:GIY-YIG nuclease family protein [Desulfobacterales bacterium]